VNGSAICNAKNSNNSLQHGGNSHKKLDTIINSSRKQLVDNRKSLTYHYIEIIIFCGHWCTCYLNIQHPPCTTHINHRSVTYWTSIPPKTKKWLTRSREEKIGFTKTWSKTIQTITVYKSYIACASHCFGFWHSDLSDTKNNINYTSGGLPSRWMPIKCARLTQVFIEHGKR